VELRSRLLEAMELEHDSLRIYQLGREWNHRVEHYGVKASYDPQGLLIV